MNEKGKRRQLFPALWIILFLAAETVLFAVIIANEFRNEYLAPVRYTSVLLCGLMAAVLLFYERRKETVLLIAAMLFTAAADWFLVVRDDRYEIALLLFLSAQSFHFVRLSVIRGRGFLWSLLIRLVLSGAFTAVIFLLHAAEPVVLLGGLYFIELLLNTVDAGILGRRDRRFVMAMVGFALFILCDISVGMNGMRAAWALPKKVSDLCADMIWVWYLPSQVLIVLSDLRDGKRRPAAEMIEKECDL